MKVKGIEAEQGGGSCNNPGVRWQGFEKGEKVLRIWPEQLKEVGLERWE